MHGRSNRGQRAKTGSARGAAGGGVGRLEKRRRRRRLPMLDGLAGGRRGFSDPVFGMSVVFAALVMYDAQGVRREAGNHAKILNKLTEAGGSESKSITATSNSEEVASVLSASEKANSYMGLLETYSLRKPGTSSSKLNENPCLKAEAKKPLEELSRSCRPLNESVGHTEIQVLVGALLGFIISLAVDTMM
ncbi:hypothetical protein AXF42_Ash021241 [Apostasia shenzhenica]|uniref:Uncharacterized protein n=1 Tax=Apostasia shenzhenica TaxID=1088818 RepID=A0A2H9ZRW4_9ASPA|nr:hypothetical protein AXF42_Ash021241 [Apostasia shenzhenica]